MWQIILQILAIIGILLLVLLGLALLLLCLVLFVPIRYRMEVDVDTETRHYLGKIKVTWLLHILTVSGAYPDPGKMFFRLFGYTFKVVDLKQSNEDVKEAEQVDEVLSTAENKADEEVQTKSEPKKDIAKDTPSMETSAKEKLKETKRSEKWYHKIVCTIRNLCAKIKEIWNTIQYYKDVLDEKPTRAFMDRSKKRLGKLLKAIAPKRIKGCLKVGTGSPDTTGYLVAVYGMMVPYLDKHFVLEPDFESAVCSGSVIASGRIYVWTVLTVVLSFVSDKQLSVLLKKLKREEK